MHKYASVNMHIHTILLENLLKVKKFLGKENFFFKKKIIDEKSAEKAAETMGKVKQNAKKSVEFFH